MDEVGSSVGILCQLSNAGEDFMELAVCKVRTVTVWLQLKEVRLLHESA